jgi:5-methylthioadenosine/S-adenosylhomocysteine deaminase
MKLRQMLDKGVSVVLGTDGTSSNNNLSMFDEMKVASLVAKLANNSPIGAQVDEIYNLATKAGAESAGLEAGVIEKGRLADIVLLDANSPQLTPSYNLISNLVYSADTSCVKTVICDGKILMQDGFIEGEAEVIENARRCAKRLLTAAKG